MRVMLAVAAVLVLAGAFNLTHVAGQGTRGSRRPASVGGFALTRPFIEAMEACRRTARFTIDPDHFSGTCSNSAQPIGYPVESVFLRRCHDNSLCQITIRLRIDGQDRLQHALADILASWTQRFGQAEKSDDGRDASCLAELADGHFGCLLRGADRVIRNWDVDERSFLAPHGTRAQLSAFGSAGSQIATIRLTLATPTGMDRAAQRDL